jgi:hypothetical protein
MFSFAAVALRVGWAAEHTRDLLLCRILPLSFCSLSLSSFYLSTSISFSLSFSPLASDAFCLYATWQVKRTKKDTALSRHRKWLADLQRAKVTILGRKERHARLATRYRRVLKEKMASVFGAVNTEREPTSPPPPSLGY